MIIRIDTLTPEMRAAIPAHVARWTAIGLSTEPADRATAEDALRRCYGFAGFAAPTILWAHSPTEMAALLVGRDTGPAVWSAVESAVWEAVWEAVGEAVWEAVWEAVGEAVGEAYDGGQTWVAWPAAESYYREVCGLTLPGDLSERGRALCDLRSSCGPMLMYERVAICCERPLSWAPLTWRAEVAS